MGRPTGVTILAIVQVLAGVLYLIAGSGVVLVGGILGDFYGAIGEAIGLLMILLGVVEFVVAWGYLTRRGWARWAGLILAAIGLVESITNLPTGALSIAIDGVIIYYLTRPHIIDWFAGKGAETPPSPA